MNNTMTIDDYVDGVLGGDRAVLGRAITLVESNRPDHRRRANEMLSRLLPHTGRSHRIGISGVPGVGKSTFIEAFGTGLVDDGHRVAVLAVDPSSSLSRGSILGDKTRMGRLAASDDAFIRPSPTGGALGGVARKTRETILVAEAAGFDVVLVETVGVGQSETVVAGMVDCFLLLSLTGAGDELQGIKRGILELAHIISINKADGDNLERAGRTRAELERALELLRPDTEDDPWRPRVVLSSAIEGTGLGEIWSLIGEHRAALEAAGLLEQKRQRQRIQWMWSLVDEGVVTSVREHPEVADMIDGLETQVVDGSVTPTAAAERILAAYGIPQS
jgi:LAO/AO transport system kinase